MQITAIIPTYKRPELLQRAVNSVLAQTYPHFEILIADNASGIPTETVVQALMRHDRRITCIKQSENIGIARNFQTALMRVATPYVCFLPDDDFYAPTFFEQNLTPFTKYPDIAFSGGGGTVFIDRCHTVRTLPPSTIKTGYYSPPQALLAYFRAGSSLQLPSTLFKTECLKQIGGFDTRLGFCIDTDLIAKCTARFPVYVQMEGLFYFYYQNSESLSLSFDLSQQEIEEKYLHENIRAALFNYFERDELERWFKEWRIRIYSKLYGQYEREKNFNKAENYAEKLSALTGSLHWRSRKKRASLYKRLPLLFPLYQGLKGVEKAIRRQIKRDIAEEKPQSKFHMHPESDFWKAYALQLEQKITY